MWSCTGSHNNEHCYLNNGRRHNLTKTDGESKMHVTFFSLLNQLERHRRLSPVKIYVKKEFADLGVIIWSLKGQKRNPDPQSVQYPDYTSKKDPYEVYRGESRVLFAFGIVDTKP